MSTELNETRFEITPRILTFGTKVVAVGHVVSAGNNRGRPFFVAGLFLIAASVGLLGFDLVLGKGLAALRSGGSTLIWAAMIGLGIGVFSLVFQRRSLTIALADGSKIHLPAARADFLRSVVTRIGEAMAADPHAAQHFRVDMTAETIEILANPPSASTAGTRSAASSPGLRPEFDHAAGVPVARDPFPTAPPERARSNNGAGPVPLNGGGLQPYQNGAAHHEFNAAGPAVHWAGNGAHPADAARGGLRPATTSSFPPHSDPAVTTGPPGNGHGTALGIPPRVPMTNGRAAPTPAANPKRELDALVALVVRSDIQHKTALLDLLNIVDDHLQGGTSSRSDAVAHWQSFAGYVDQYLADVEGLLPLTRRVGRNFTHA